jgi:hypothetical protein
VAALLAVHSALYRLVDGYRGRDKWRDQHAVEHAPEWNAVATMRGLLDMMLSTALAVVFTRPDEAEARASVT